MNFIPLIIKNWKTIVGGFGFLIIAAFMVNYWNMVNEVGALRLNEGILRHGIQVQEETIQKQEIAITQWQKAVNKLEQDIQEARRIAKEAESETRRLNELFKKHDLRKLALAKPGLIENRINNGSANSIRLLECASGDSTSCDGSDHNPTQ